MEINAGRFVKGHKLGKRYEKGNISWSTKNKGLYTAKRTSESRSSAKYKDWSRLVKEKDGNKCVKCSSEKRISSHHIKPWKDCKELRFDVQNGMTLCAICHGKEEGFQKGRIPIFTSETRKKISEAHKGKKISSEHLDKLLKGRIGKPGPNKGRTFSSEHRKRISEARKEKPGNRTGIKSKNPCPLIGKKLSEEHRKKLSEAAKRRWQEPQLMT